MDMTRGHHFEGAEPVTQPLACSECGGGDLWQPDEFLPSRECPGPTKDGAS